MGRNHVLVMLRDTLTTSEKTLTDAGYSELVLTSREALQAAMRAEATDTIQELTGRRVIGFLSDNHLEPDLAAELFIVEPAADGHQVTEADATE